MKINHNATTADMINFMSGHFQTRNLNPSDLISNSWRRSIFDHGLEPSQKDIRTILTPTEVHNQMSDVEDFWHIAKTGAENLAQRLMTAGYSVILTNNKGVTIHSACEPSRKRHWNDLGITIGAVWKESLSGTSAISTILIEEEPLTVHLNEHFMINNIPLSCSACPIFDPQGNLLAVLDASCINPKHSKDEQQVVLHLVTLYSRWIENTYIKYLHKRNHIISIQPNLHFYENGMEHILVVNDRKVIIGANKIAINKYQQQGSKQLLGSMLGDIINTNLDILLAHPITVCTTTFCKDEVQVSIESPEKSKPVKTSIAKTKPSRKNGNNQAQQHPSLTRLTGHDEQLISNVQRLVRVIDKGIPILITGETGTGKEAFARAIHDNSERSAAPFIAINCASIPESLIESELFGYRSGSFTGANKQGMKGKLELANGGTLFLDEIGDMPILLQTRLLRVLAEKEVMALGAHEPVYLDINVISATHQNIMELVKTNHFREDLFYRLNGMLLQLPALRNRTDNEHIIRLIIDSESNSTVEINRAALKTLSQYRWPGNIRQLINTIRYATAMCDNGMIDVSCLPAEVLQSDLKVTQLQPQLTIPARSETPAPLEVTVQHNEEAQATSIKERRDRRTSLTLLDSLRRNKWNITDTANDLGTCRSTIYRQMKKYDIDQPNNFL